tara:strand:- start:347 stop:610 length:264 start_codon:yes stop_codon:yes gene_type:complete
MSDTSQNKEEHWQRTRSLMIKHLVVWFVFAYLIHWHAPSLNQMAFMDFPLGFYMAAQGSLVIFVVQLFLFARQQDQIDRDCGLAESD